MKLTVIITTYNSEKWLEKVLEGYCSQTEKDFEIVVADDGSNELTKNVIDLFSDRLNYPIQHVWQEDTGFQKCKILNKAIIKSQSDYLLFTDGDCIPRADFVAQHLKYKEQGFFLSGGYFKLSMFLSHLISIENIQNQDCFSIKWLIKNGLSINFKLSKLTKLSFFSSFMNWITPTKKTFNGHNASCYKSDLMAVNGFNEYMQYGGLDREFGERLQNFGVASKQIRYAAVCLHLDHKRAYSSKENWKKNKEIRNFNAKNKITYIDNGVSNYLK
jgi:glycosyltransferase involved in cell wall biosynthesis